MGKRVPNLRLAAGELELLELLWRTGGATLAQTHGALDRRVGYTTVQTRLNRLVKKGLVTRSRDWPACYRAAVSREEVSAQDLNLLMARVSGGRVVPLVAHLIRDRRLDVEEIEELKRLITDAERKSRGR